MKRLKIFSMIGAFSLIVALIAVSCQKEIDSNLNRSDLKMDIPGSAYQQYIVILATDPSLALELQSTADYSGKQDKMHGFINGLLSRQAIGKDQVDNVFTTAFQGFTAKLNDRQLEKLSKDPMVESILPDEVFVLAKPIKNPTTPTDPPQVVPWGITRVGGGLNATGKTAWVVDSGVDLDHRDLLVDVARSKSFVSTDRKADPDDQHGHGTHVAGTIAALDNSIGVIGVAAGAKLVSCRVLDRRGSGQISWGIAALEYIEAVGSAGDVVNMSIGPQSRYTNNLYDAAVIAVASKGIFVAIAAGNESDDASYYSPARTNHTNVFTVSAMDSKDVFAYFSNFGNPVDFCAPGVSVYSTYKGGSYATMSGTSMASPHMAGLLLLGSIHSDGFVTGDPDGNPDPIAHH